MFLARSSSKGGTKRTLRARLVWPGWSEIPNFHDFFAQDSSLAFKLFFPFVTETWDLVSREKKWNGNLHSLVSRIGLKIFGSDLAVAFRLLQLSANGLLTLHASSPLLGMEISKCEISNNKIKRFNKLRKNTRGAILLRLFTDHWHVYTGHVSENLTSLTSRQHMKWI